MDAFLCVLVESVIFIFFKGTQYCNTVNRNVCVRIMCVSSLTRVNIFFFTGDVRFTPEDFTRAQKYCKYAGSALQYEDVDTAIQNLQKALKLLTTGKEWDHCAAPLKPLYQRSGPEELKRGLFLSPICIKKRHATAHSPPITQYNICFCHIGC